MSRHQVSIKQLTDTGECCVIVAYTDELSTLLKVQGKKWGQKKIKINRTHFQWGNCIKVLKKPFYLKFRVHTRHLKIKLRRMINGTSAKMFATTPEGP